jgi:hypothetical protein
MKLFYALLILLLLFSYFFHPIPLQGLNVDLGHHLLFGKIMIENQKILGTNLVSYTFPDFKFVNSQWLSQLVLYLWQNTFNFDGLIFLGVFLVISSFGLLFIKTITKNFYSGILVSIFYIQLIVDRTEIKPELFSWLFLSLFIFILYKYKAKYTNLIYVLIPLQILWINFHIFYFVGNVLLFIFLIDNYWEEKLSLSKKFKTLLVVNIFSGLGLLLNPWFLKGAVLPFYVLNDYGYKVIENLNFFKAFTDHRDITFSYYIACLILLWLGLYLYRKTTSLLNFLLSFFFSFMSLYAVRNIPMFMFGTLIPMTEIVSKVTTNYSIPKMKILVILIILSIIPAAIWSFKIHGIGLGIKDEAMDSIKFVKANHISGPIYNNYNIGNYLEYAIYPSDSVFVDGNPESYPGSFFRDIYYPMEKTYQNFSKFADKYNFNLIYYDYISQASDQNPVLGGLITDPNWKLIYLNNRIVIFIKNIPQNKSIIDKYLITENSLKINQEDLSSQNKLREYSNLFRIFTWYQKMYDMDMKYLEYDSKNCVALRHIVVVMSSQKNPDLPEYSSKYSRFCH